MSFSIQHVGWSLGNYCNARCGHCYSWQVRSSPASLSAEHVDHIVDELISVGVKTVNLGGNEPIFTHGPNPKDSLLPHIIRRATSAGLTVGVTSNGTTPILLEKHAPDAFEAVHEWHLSIDSPMADEHDRNRGGPYFHLAKTALGLTASRGVSRTIIYTAMAWNTGPDHVRGLLLLASSFGADLRVNTVKPTEPGMAKLALSPTQYFRFFRELARWSAPTVVGEPILASAWGLPSEGCPCGVSSLRINGVTADGRVPVSPCVFLHELREGDLLTEPLREIVTRPAFEALRGRRARTPRACQERACELIDTCRGGCAASAALQSRGDILSRLELADPYCLHDAREDGVAEAAPLPCALVIPRDRVRVHEGYLCTVIATPRNEPAWVEAPARAEPSLARPDRTLPAAAWAK